MSSSTNVAFSSNSAEKGLEKSVQSDIINLDFL